MSQLTKLRTNKFPRIGERDEPIGERDEPIGDRDEPIGECHKLAGEPPMAIRWASVLGASTRTRYIPDQTRRARQIRTSIIRSSRAFTGQGKSA